MLEMVKEGNFLHTTELENMVSTCFRALDGSNYDVRSAVSKLLGVLLSTTQTNISKGEILSLGRWLKCRVLSCTDLAGHTRWSCGVIELIHVLYHK